MDYGGANILVFELSKGDQQLNFSNNKVVRLSVSESQYQSASFVINDVFDGRLHVLAFGPYLHISILL